MDSSAEDLQFNVCVHGSYCYLLPFSYTWTRLPPRRFASLGHRHYNSDLPGPVGSARSSVVLVVSIPTARNAVKHNAYQLPLVQAADRFLENVARC